MQSGIYQIVNTANGKSYIGSAKSLRNRLAVHKRRLRRGDHHSPHLQAAWNKYGEAAFEHRVLLMCEPRNLVMYEQTAIDALVPEYNVCKTAGSRLGHKASDATRAKLSEARRGKRLTDEHKAKVSAGLRGHQVSDEARARMSAAKVGRPGPRRGMRNSEEHRAKLSAALKGRESPKAKRVRVGGVLYPSAAKAAQAVGCKAGTLRAMLRGGRPNKIGARYAS